MERCYKKIKNYTVRDYMFEKTLVRYVIMDETKAVFMLLIPESKRALTDDTYFTEKVKDEYPDHRDWFAGSLVHLHLSHHINSSYGNSYKFSQSIKKLKYSHQDVYEDENSTVIKTYLVADEGYRVCHILKNYAGENGFIVKTKFFNDTGKTVTLEMISSASLDNISPFTNDDSSESLILHTFRGGWSAEGKHIKQTLPELNMEKSWGGSFESERIGSIGSKSVGRYFPYAVLEDKKTGCSWGIKLKHNATWQMELTRYGVKLSLSAGIGDLSFGGWYKHIENGCSFETPEAYIAAVEGDEADVSNALLRMCGRAADEYGEKGMPIVFNEWCTTWGEPTHDRLLKIADRMKGGRVKYFVIDAGWFEKGNGEWKLKASAFPYGMDVFAEEIRKRGMVPGIWMEFECVDESSKRFSDEYNGLYLSKFGIPLCGTINNAFAEKFIDFANPEAVEFLNDAVIGFLKKNKIGYLKVDYNSNIGIGCDGTESLGEGLRQHMERVYEFFIKIKQEIPDIIIENCSSGGSRLDPKMISASAMSSFSDAHEAFEVPVIAANLQYLVPPRQCQVWCVLRKSFSAEHMKYICAAGFLGRLCWSGDIDELEDWQFSMMREAEEMYSEVSEIIKNGSSRIYRTYDTYNLRNLRGTQAVLRYSEDKTEALLVYHCFNKPESMEIMLEDASFKIVKSLYDSKSRLENKRIIIDTSKERCGNVIYLSARK